MYNISVKVNIYLNIRINYSSDPTKLISIAYKYLYVTLVTHKLVPLYIPVTL